MSRRKYSKEFKLQVLREHDEGASFYSLEKKYGITLGTVKRWNSAFRAHGEDVLEHQNSNLCRYTAEFKKKVVLDYLSGGGSGQSVAVKYSIHAESTVLKWVKQYNSHVELTDSRKHGGSYALVFAEPVFQLVLFLLLPLWLDLPGVWLAVPLAQALAWLVSFCAKCSVDRNIV